MTHRTMPPLLALALATPLTAALADDRHSRKCSPRNDSEPSSLGATGWGAVDGPVTGGCGAGTRVFHVHDRRQLAFALNKDLPLLDHFFPGLNLKKGNRLDGHLGPVGARAALIR